MSEDWTTVFVFNFVTDAQVMRTLLQSEGIETLIPEEHTASLTPIFTNMVVRVQVREKDVERVRVLAKEMDLPGMIGAEPDTGQGSTSAPRKVGLGNWLRAIVGLLFGVPIPRKDTPEDQGDKKDP